MSAVEPACWNCGVELPPSKGARSPRKWCGTRCRAAYRAANDDRAEAWQEATRRRHYRRAHPRHWWRLCALCGAFYLPRRARGTCPNAECFTRRRRNEAIWQSGRYRAERHGGEVERFDVAQVFARDRFTCHLCGGLVTYGLEPLRSPESATIDHIVPLEHGGDHTAENVATAHFSCNASRNTQDVNQARERLSLQRIGAEVPPAEVVDLYTAVRRTAEALSEVPVEFDGGPPRQRRTEVRA